MNMAEKAKKVAMLYEDVIESIAEECLSSDQFIKPIALFVKNQVYQHLQAKLAKGGFCTVENDPERRARECPVSTWHSL